MIKELFQSVKSHFLKYASSLKVERQLSSLIFILEIFDAPTDKVFIYKSLSSRKYNIVNS